MLDLDPAARAVEEAVSLGRRRLLTQLGAEGLCLAATIALAGVVLLLMVGAGRFPSILLWAFALGGVGFAFYRWKGAVPSGYLAARVLDARWQANDQVSTAYYFAHQGRREDEQSRALDQQRAMAAQAVVGRDVADALPWTTPRAARWTAWMLLLALVLFGLRLSVQPKLSLEPPLPSLLLPSLAAADEKPEVRRFEEQAAAEVEAFDAAGDEQLAAALEQAERTAADDESDEPFDQVPFEMPEVEGLSVDGKAGDELSFEGGEESGGERAGAESQPAEQGAELADAEGAERPEDSGDWSEESNSMLERLKDAFEKMVENLSMDEPKPSQNASQESGEGSETSGEPGEQAAAEAEGAGEQPSEAEMEGGEPGDGAPQQTAQGQGSSDSQEGGESGQSAAASGSADGDKQIAEQAAREAALDELEEFYMQRAEDLVGEVMVETTESEQLGVRTPLQSLESGHADRGGAVSRDEAPAAYRQYVEHYFRNLRAKEAN